MERVLKAHDAHKRVEAVSIDERVGFHEKLAVLTSGSLALAVSGAVAVYQKPLQTSSVTHWLLWCLVASAVFLWLSLVASVMHNFLESCAKDAEKDRSFFETTREMFRAVLDSEEIKECDQTTKEEVIELVEPGFLEPQRRYVTRTETFRKFEKFLSIAASSLFVLGYFPVVICIIRLAIYSF